MEETLGPGEVKELPYEAGSARVSDVTALGTPSFLCSKTSGKHVKLQAPGPTLRDAAWGGGIGGMTGVSGIGTAVSHHPG